MSFYNELRLRQQLCDTVIRVDGAEFYAHKVVLCKCSPYFRALFSHWSTPDCMTYDIPGVSPSLMRVIIEYAYTGFVPLTKQNAQELFIVADRYNITGLLQACCDFLEKQLSPLNCLSIWMLTDTFYHPELRHKAIQYALSHFKEVVVNCADFLLLSAQQLVQIIESDLLIVKQEETVYEAVLKWIAYLPEERKEYSSLLFSKIRLAWMSPKYLIENVNESELVKTSPECRAMLLQTLNPILDHMNSYRSFVCQSLAKPRVPPALLLAVGGWTDGSPTSLIEAYDTRTDCWVDLACTTETLRAYHGAVFLDGSVYCVGGFDSVEQFSTVHRLDLASQTWQEVSPMHASRCFVSVTVVNGYIYALGGYNGHERLNTAERYEPRSNQWTIISSMHEPRSDASCATLHDRLYICGGFNGIQCLFTAECYNPDTDQWTLIANMSSRRSGVGVAAYADHIFAVGGFDGVSRLDTAEAYNPSTNTWSNVPSMPTARSNFGISVMDDHLFAVGGFGGVTTIPDVEFYDIKTNVWFSASDMKISRSALSCCVVNGPNNMTDYASPLNTSELHLPSKEEDEMEQ
ncbi:kelch-like protein 10 [Girardinichthys multiradiatus]|uniref:kelch-like protein 10 n=1 Tax=Girardinichthys multiradiatus TaxID=208333 RepID=UPI001FAD0CFA|nr:kelch-like protein 10 [Girardinichthys multiradiatus]